MQDLKRKESNTKFKSLILKYFVKFDPTTQALPQILKLTICRPFHVKLVMANARDLDKKIKLLFFRLISYKIYIAMYWTKEEHWSCPPPPSEETTESSREETKRNLTFDTVNVVTRHAALYTAPERREGGAPRSHPLKQVADQPAVLSSALTEPTTRAGPAIEVLNIRLNSKKPIFSKITPI